MYNIYGYKNCVNGMRRQINTDNAAEVLEKSYFFKMPTVKLKNFTVNLLWEQKNGLAVCHYNEVIFLLTLSPAKSGCSRMG